MLKKPGELVSIQFPFHALSDQYTRTSGLAAAVEVEVWRSGATGRSKLSLDVQQIAAGALPTPVAGKLAVGIRELGSTGEYEVIFSLPTPVDVDYSVITREPSTRHDMTTEIEVRSGTLSDVAPVMRGAAY